MEIVLVINLLAVVLFLALILSQINKKMWSEADKIFFVLLMVCFLCAITDMIDIIINGRQEIPRIFHHINTSCYFVLRNLTPFLYVTYIITIIGRNKVVEKNSSLGLFVIAPIIVSMITIFLNGWHMGIFYYDEQHVYHRGTLVPILYVISAYYMFFSMFYTLRFRASITFEKRVAIYAFCPVSIFCVGVQLFFPQARIEMYGTAICVMLIMFTIQRQEEAMEGATGLWNRSSFIKRVYDLFGNQQKFSVISVNIKNLKPLNETIGRMAVDRLLHDIAYYIRSFKTETGFIYAMGNGKFNILLTRRKRHRADILAERIQERFQQSWNSNGVDIQLQGCVSLFCCPEEIKSKEEVLRYTDEFHKYTSFSNQVLKIQNFDWDKFTFEENLQGIIENALLEKKFEVYYQPIYSVKDGSFTSAEALLRLYDEKYGFIPPDKFISVAEANMSIIKIDKYVLEHVCEFIAANNLKERGIRHIHVNLSAVQCMQKDMASQILNIINSYGIDPHFINLEITESSMMYFPEVMKNNMLILKSHGVNFSMDDYGSGYSNINYLWEFPFSTIKLDRRIVCAHETENEKRWIALKYSIEMLQDMGFDIVAEGVETKKMVEDISKQGCHYLQGFYFSKALPGVEFLRYIDSKQSHA